MNNLKIKIVCGFRKDQHYSIDADEAHKAYYLFLHPNERGVFNSGLALVGSNIQAIEPDYIATMGWNVAHVLDSDDWNELRSKKIDQQLRDVMYLAKSVAQTEPAQKMNLPLSEIRKLLE